jgi:hypothetical protein
LVAPERFEPERAGREQPQTGEKLEFVDTSRVILMSFQIEFEIKHTKALLEISHAQGKLPLT